MKSSRSMAVWFELNLADRFRASEGLLSRIHLTDLVKVLNTTLLAAPEVVSFASTRNSLVLSPTC